MSLLLISDLEIILNNETVHSSAMAQLQENPVSGVVLNGHTIDSNEIKTAFKTSVSPLSDPKVESNDTTEIKPKFEIEEHPIDQVRDIRVGIIGAGLSGVTAATLLRAKLPGINVTVYDKNGDVVSRSN